MADKPNLTQLSKFLALMLRHRAAQFRLELDAEGFTDVDRVWRQVEIRFPRQYTFEDLLAVVDGDRHGKKRYELRDGRIRALFGHSSVTPITYAPAVPPDVLYHGTRPEAIEAIKDQGLLAMKRQYVHLGTRIDLARRVAQRSTRQPVILHIRAKAAHDAGVVFFNPEADHYLARHIPAAFIDFPDDE